MNERANANRLIRETSPYLKQHAHNPVDWFPWGPEALAESRRLDRPIFLSIGYSACHWCHVMEHESFEDTEVARILKENFISIKVDREERPDLDHIYMTAVQILTGQGGWPMSMFLTPDLKPFYGGTYFPPDNRYGRPSFKSVLTQVAEAWRSRREEIDRAAAEITDRLQEVAKTSSSGQVLNEQLLRHAGMQLSRAFDAVYGGFGSAPKFPHATELRLLLRLWQRFGDDHALHMARTTLDHMAMGGIYDHLGGGFHRYSTDEHWLVPHFEKMLYDNALLSQAYLEAFQTTGNERYRRVVEETLDYVLREMTSPEGAFFSTQDADSEGEEGKFFVWSLEEVVAILGKEQTDTFGYVYDINLGGNWEGKTILHRTKTDEQDARLLNISTDDLRQQLNSFRAKMLEARNRRVWPGRDEKILTAWNALMVSSLAQAGAVLEEPRYVQAAVRAATFLVETMVSPEGRLYRTWSAGSEPKLNAYQEDYAYLIVALTDLYEATFNLKWLETALALSRTMIDEFWDDDAGGFFFTGHSHESLVARIKHAHDSSTPSGNGMAAAALLRLSHLTSRAELAGKAEQILKLYADDMSSSAMAAGQLLIALDFYFGPVDEIALIGDEAEEETQQAMRLVRRSFRPHQVVAFKSLKQAGEEAEPCALLSGKQPQGTLTAYVCRNGTCSAPVVGIASLTGALK